jgi:hypothetical protein
LCGPADEGEDVEVEAADATEAAVFILAAELATLRSDRGSTASGEREDWLSRGPASTWEASTARTLAARLAVALPTRRNSILLNLRRIGPGASSSSESLHPRPVVRPTPSRRSFPSRWRRFRTSLLLFNLKPPDDDGREAERA